MINYILILQGMFDKQSTSAINYIIIIWVNDKINISWFRSQLQRALLVTGWLNPE